MPDLHATTASPGTVRSEPVDAGPDEIDLARSREYGLLAMLLSGPPGSDLLAALGTLPGDETPLGQAHRNLAAAARASTPEAVARRYFDLFVGLGRGEILPYASFYLTGFLHERPLARLRADLDRIGIARRPGESEPEDHIALICDVMAGLAAGRFGSPDDEAGFFDRHLRPWAGTLFGDLKGWPDAGFYGAVGAYGETLFGIERDAFDMAA